MTALLADWPILRWTGNVILWAWTGLSSLLCASLIIGSVAGIVYWIGYLFLGLR